MSYTSKELKQIAYNIEVYRLERARLKDISPQQDAKLYRIIKEIHKISYGQYTKEVQKECIPYFNTFA